MSFCPIDSFYLFLSTITEESAAKQNDNFFLQIAIYAFSGWPMFIVQTDKAVPRASFPFCGVIVHQSMFKVVLP